jgi:hypothetical protein
MTRYQIAFHRSDNHDPSEDEAMVVARRASVEVREFFAVSTEQKLQP